MTKENPSLPASGLAEDMIPLLRAQLGMPRAEAPTGDSGSLLDFAAEMERRAPVVASKTARAIQLVTFVLDTEEYGVPIERTREILRVGAIARVPEAPEHVRGVMNVRGRLLPVLDLRSRMGLALAPLDKDSRIVMVEAHTRVLGLLVDRVSYVLKVTAESIEPAPPEVLGKRADYIVGVATHEARMIIVLDLDRVLSLSSE